MADESQTIFALSSGRPPAAIAVVRVSGPRAGVALQALIGRLPAPRQAALARVRDPQTGEPIDEALALWFPGPRSETGEDVAELQLHGGQAVIAATFAALSSIEGLRPAEAGEFTRRAFLHGQLDLTQVEGLADLIAAETDAQRRLAFRHLKGLLGARAESWRSRVIEARALVEAGIDFSDEGDVPGDLVGPALATVSALADEIGGVLKQASHGEKLRDGLVVAIAGPPNAGKSTLLNRLAQREAAIVSPYPGTTRDVIEVHLDLVGYPVTLLDTAGIRETYDPVEREGVARARKRAEEADLVLWVTDASHADEPGRDPDAARWSVRNKIDLGTPAVAWAENVFPVSATSGVGFGRLIDALAGFARNYFAATESALIVRARHRATLLEVYQALARIAALPRDRDDLMAEELRLAANALGRLTGRIDVEHVLDAIFRDFCIGK